MVVLDRFGRISLTTKTYPFYRCKHRWIICWVDKFGTVYKCYKCGKLKNKDWNNKITYIE